jgi:hypothetical protein
MRIAGLFLLPVLQVQSHDVLEQFEYLSIGYKLLRQLCSIQHI